MKRRLKNKLLTVITVKCVEENFGFIWIRLKYVFYIESVDDNLRFFDSVGYLYMYWRIF